LRAQTTERNNTSRSSRAAPRGRRPGPSLQASAASFNCIRRFQDRARQESGGVTAAPSTWSGLRACRGKSKSSIRLTH